MTHLSGSFIRSIHSNTKHTHIYVYHSYADLLVLSKLDDTLNEWLQSCSSVVNHFLDLPKKNCAWRKRKCYDNTVEDRLIDIKK